MARYIDADKLIAFLESWGDGEPVVFITMNQLKYAISFLEATFPTEVVPKSEVERLQEEADRYKRYFYRHDYDEMIAEAKAEVAREIFEEIEQIIENSKYQQLTPFGTEERYNPYLIKKHIADLKKKYTEGADE